MTVFTYSEARQNFASLLNKAGEEGKVFIRRRDGSLFSVTPEKESKSPLDVKCIKSSATTKDILAAIRESREK